MKIPKLKNIKHEEGIVKAYLEHWGCENILYEPIKNEAPDFLINNETAIEVRRLNQHYFGVGRVSGLEDISYRLWQSLDDLMRSMGPSMSGESWFISFRFHRPIPKLRTLKSKVKIGLERFIDADLKAPGVILSEPGFELEIVARASEAQNAMFVLLGCIDQQEGGWLLDKMAANLIHCIRDKEFKVAKNKSKYPSWWLILVDTIGYGLSESNVETLKSNIQIEHGFDRVIVVDPGICEDRINRTHWFDL